MRPRSLVLAGGLAAMLASPILADDPLRIADLAPEGAFLVVGADDISATCKSFNATPLAGLWRTEAVQKTVGEQMEEMLGGMMESLEEEGFEGEPKMPRSMGVAVYADLDEETGMSRAFVLGFADWVAAGEDAGRMFDFMVERIEDGEEARIDRREIRGREVVVVERIAQDEGDDDEFGGEFDAMLMFGDPADFAPNLDTMYVVRDAGRVLFANDLLAIDEALGTIDGDGGDHLAGTDDWSRTMTQLGPADGYLVLRTGPLQNLLAPLFMGPLGLAKPLIGEVFGDVRSYGFGATVPEDADTASMVLTASMLMPEGKGGLFSLVEGVGPVGAAPPRVVGADAIGYGTIRVDFAGLVPLANRLAAALPMGGEELEMALEQFGPMVEAGLGTMGPEMHVVSTVRRPIEVDSAATTVVIPTSDPKKVQPLLAMFGPGMDLEPRDFLGETLWSNEMNGIAAAVAGNWVVLGSPRGVEQVVRGLGDGGDAHDLAGLDSFRNAVDMLPKGDVVGWGWTDVVSQYAAQRETMKGMMDMLGAGAFDEFAPIDPAQADQMEFASDLMDSLTPEELANHVGPSVWTFSSDDLGLVYRQWFLNPEKK